MDRIVRGNSTRTDKIKLIQQALAAKNGSPRMLGVTPEQVQSMNTPVVRQQSKRPPQKVVRNPQPKPRPTSPPPVDTTENRLIFEIRRWIESPNSDYYTGLGGMGDALLVLSSCWNNPRAKIVFFANLCSIDFARQFFQAFQIPALVHPNIMGQPWAPRVIDFIKNHPNFRTSGHLADRLDYGDWRDVHKYKNRIVTQADWISKFGKHPNPYHTQGVISICPSGSVKDKHRQRFLSREEYEVLARKFLDRNYTVYTVSSEADMRVYGILQHQHAVYVTSDRIVDWKKHTTPIAMNKMLSIVNSSNRVISMDTWLKTYSLICGIPTHVVMTRWNGVYKPVGDDVTDFVFLDPRIWPNIQLTTVEAMASW
jgi:hypothetical protein